MTGVPEIHYAKNGDTNLAYQVFGDGPVDLVTVWGYVSHTERFWEHPLAVRYFERLASFARVINFDRGGTGLSDRSPENPTLERRMDDILSVMDAAGSDRAAVYGSSEGGPIATLFAATYPDRTAALVLYGTWARVLAAPGFDIGFAPEVAGQFVEQVIEHWGTPETLTVPALAVSKVDDRVFCEWWARVERSAGTPNEFRELMRVSGSIDVRDVLPAVRVPTLVLHRAGDVIVPAAQGRYVAARIPGARYVELEGFDHIGFVGDADAVLDEIEEFLTGSRHAPEADRVLATVLFTDVVGSTERAAELGDARWRSLLDEFDAGARREVERFRGSVVKHTGDGHLSTFDGPGRAVCCARALHQAAAPLNLELRAGLHTGEIEMRDGDVTGIAVHTAARVMAEAGPGEVLVSRTVVDLVAGSGLEFADRGTRELKGVPGQWQLYEVVG